MDYIINWTVYETVFNGDRVTAELLPLTNDGSAVFIDYFRNMKSKAQIEAMTDDEKIGTQKALLENIKNLKPILANHVRNVQGFTVNGAAPTLDQIVDHAAFFGLVIEWIGELGQRSRLMPVDEKN